MSAKSSLLELFLNRNDFERNSTKFFHTCPDWVSRPRGWPHRQPSLFVRQPRSARRSEQHESTEGWCAISEPPSISLTPQLLRAPAYLRFTLATFALSPIFARVSPHKRSLNIFPMQHNQSEGREAPHDSTQTLTIAHKPSR